VVNAPFMMIKEETEVNDGKDEYEGFNVDLIKLIAEHLGFNFTLEFGADGIYGRYDESKGSWSGMIGELLSQKADLVLADMTITSEREEVMDFTMPYMDQGLTILYKKERRQKQPSIFSFLAPFTSEVWISILAAYLVMAFLLFSISRVTPGGPVPDKGAKVLPDKGKPSLARGVPTCLISSLWWVFTLVLACCYTANLGAFLRTEPLQQPLQSFDDLSRQNRVRYGVLHGGSTYQFFKDSKVSIFHNMWTYMSEHPSLLTRSYHEGVERVKKGDGAYAFIMESTVADYLVDRDCELTHFGEILNRKGYGIGLPLNSPYRKPMSNAILKLQEDGSLENLRKKWWFQKRGGGQCAVGSDSGGVTVLGLATVGGIFVVLVVGLGLACIAAIVEYLCNRKAANTSS